MYDESKTTTTATEQSTTTQAATTTTTVPITLRDRTNFFVFCNFNND